ncbi:hypothetical protein ASE38_17155 [Cellulomonas sp. Root930]|nr:hypothetical protein ASE38_17155 [Cellulomonas sp. Root930]
MTSTDHVIVETFEELAPLRRRGVDGLRANGWETGFRDLLADLYPDNAHFIYELLQNAEDAGAREVTFDLRPDGLYVEHDGTRLFSLADIVSITGIGKSTKAHDATSIGKFGVGFKAVFAYTQKPVIHSGEYSFEIVDLFVPTRVVPDARPGRTTFWFPFDRSDKPPARAVAEVAKALRDVSRSTLLFLSNIRTIASYFPDGDERLLERRKVDADVIAIESVHEEAGPSYWYRVTDDIEINGENFTVAAAFALENLSEGDSKPAPLDASSSTAAGVERRARSTDEFRVEPIDGQVFIYFPAFKETSGLKFHIHAPFASTVARDSVRDDEGNDELIAGIAGLVARALPAMRDANLVNDGLLSALPNKADELQDRYEVIRGQVLRTFETQPLTPTSGSGGHHESKRLVRSVSALRAALEPNDVDVLREISVGVGDTPAAGWLPERDGRSRAFLDSLEAIDFSPSALSEVFERLGQIAEEIKSWGDPPDEDEYLDEEDTTDIRSWMDWISGKDDPWIRALYAALGRVASQGHNPYARNDYRYLRWSDPFPDSLAAVPIIRAHLGAGVQHISGDDAFLPQAPGITLDGLVLDALIAFDDGDTRTEKQDAHALREFYSHAGVKAWNAAAQLDGRFAGYQAGVEFELEDHFEDLRVLSRLLQERAVAATTYSGRAIFLAKDFGGGLVWSKPSLTYLDEPFGSTGLATLYGSAAFAGRDHPLSLADEYRNCGFDVEGLARLLGAEHSIEITSTSPQLGNAEFQWDWAVNETHLRVSTDWTIKHFDAIVATDDETLLRALWKVVTAAPADRAVARYQANRSRANHMLKSQLLQKLTTVPWVLDRYGNRALPEDMTPADLDDSLVVPSEAPLLIRAGFGRKAAADEKDRAGADEAAQKFGFASSDDLVRLGELRKQDPERFADVLNQLEAELQLPEGASLAPERRAQRAAASAIDASARKYEKRVRSVYIQVPGHLSAARGYLRGLYTNPDGVMVCQVCLSALPFRVGGEYYFEAVQFIKDEQRDLRENRLALCPTCAAKYRHARSTPLRDLREDLLTQDVGTHSSILIDVILAGEHQRIRLVGKHAIDLQAALEAVDGSPLDGEDADEDAAAEAEQDPD